MNPYVIPALVVVLLVTIGIGAYGLRFARTTSDFLVASRTVSPSWNAAAISGEYLSAASFLGVAGLILRYGVDVLWYPVGFAAGYLALLLFVAAPLRRSGAFTLPDFCELRLRSLRLRRIATVFVIFIGCLYLVPQLHGAGLTFTTVTGGSYQWGALLVGLVVTANVALGGMHPDRPGAVAEVTFDLADDGGDGVAGEVDAAVGVELVDGLDKSDGGGLDQVVGGFAAAGVAVGEMPGQRQPRLDRAIPQRRAGRVPDRHRRHGVEEFGGAFRWSVDGLGRGDVGLRHGDGHAVSSLAPVRRAWPGGGRRTRSVRVSLSARGRRLSIIRRNPRMLGRSVRNNLAEWAIAD
jgi:hypothetical protein